MEFWVSAGVSAILEVLADRRSVTKIVSKLAKVFVAIERESQVNSSLAAAIEKARAKG
jgi:hypothetical protein